MGESGRSTKKNFEQGKIKWKKNSCMPINPKKIFMLWPKKNSFEEFDNEKNSCGSKVLLLQPPPPPLPSHNGPSLNILGRFHTFFHLRVVLRQLFDTVKGKYQKSKEIATDSNLIWDVMLYSRHSWALHLPLETTCSCKQGTKVRYWQTELTRPVKVDHLQSWSRIF